MDEVRNCNLRYRVFCTCLDVKTYINYKIPIRYFVHQLERHSAYLFTEMN